MQPVRSAVVVIAMICLSPFSTGSCYALAELTEREPVHQVFQFTPTDESAAEPYLIQSPAHIEPGRRYPLLIFLHGAGGSHTQQWLHPDLAAFRREALAHDYFVLSPHLGSTHWFDDRAERVLSELLDKVIEEYPIDVSRVDVMGISMGGGSALGFAIAHPDRVRSVCNVFGLTDLTQAYDARDYREAIGKRFGGSAEQVAEAMKRKSAIKNLNAFAHTPTMVIHGTSDNVISIEHSRCFVAAMKKRDNKVEYIEKEGIGHTNKILKGSETDIFTFFEASPPTVVMHETPDGVRYGVAGGSAGKSAPTLFIFAGTVALSLGQGDLYYMQAGKFLSKRGFVCVSIDLPCHGTDRQRDEPEGLSGWRHRLDHDDAFIKTLNSRLSSVLDDVINRGYSDEKRIGACGVSRGGFVACHFTASDPRVRAVAAFAPVTELGALTEFKGAAARDNVTSLNLSNQSTSLANRALYIVIGDQDQRVSTDAAVHFAKAVAKAAVDSGQPDNVILQVLPEPRGHTVPQAETTFREAAQWLENALK